MKHICIFSLFFYIYLLVLICWWLPCTDNNTQISTDNNTQISKDDNISILQSSSSCKLDHTDKLICFCRQHGYTEHAIRREIRRYTYRCPLCHERHVILPSPSHESGGVGGYHMWKQSGGTKLFGSF